MPNALGRGCNNTLIPHPEITHETEGRVDERRGLVVLKEEVANPSERIADQRNDNRVTPIPGDDAMQTEESDKKDSKFDGAVLQAEERSACHVTDATARNEGECRTRMRGENGNNNRSADEMQSPIYEIGMLRQIKREELIELRVRLRRSGGACHRFKLSVSVSDGSKHSDPRGEKHKSAKIGRVMRSLRRWRCARCVAAIRGVRRFRHRLRCR